MDLLEAFITFGGAFLCMLIPTLVLGVVIVWLVPRISGFLGSGK
jgi:hypothetical protein